MNNKHKQIEGNAILKNLFNIFFLYIILISLLCFSEFSAKSMQRNISSKHLFVYPDILF